MVELLSAELIELIQEDPQHAIEVADEHLSMLEEKPLHPMGGYSQSYLEAAQRVNDAVHKVAEVEVEREEGAGVTVYEASGNHEGQL